MQLCHEFVAAASSLWIDPTGYSIDAKMADTLAGSTSLQVCHAAASQNRAECIAELAELGHGQTGSSLGASFVWGIVAARHAANGGNFLS